MSDTGQETTPRRQLLVIRHLVIVDGETVYVGEDWTEAAGVFLKHAQHLDARQVIHRVDKKLIPLYSDPRSIKW